MRGNIKVKTLVFESIKIGTEKCRVQHVYLVAQKNL